MHTTFSAAISCTLLLSLFIVFGYGLRKLRLCANNAGTVISSLLMNFFMPVFMIKIIMENISLETISDGRYYLIAACLIIVVTYFLAVFSMKPFEKHPTKYTIFVFALVFPNFGFMGQPIVEAVYGSSAMFDWAMYTLPYYLVVNVLGLYVMRPNKNSRMKLSQILNPLTLSIPIGLILAFLKVSFPPVVQDFITMASQCVVPLSMVLTGFVLAGESLKKMFLNPKIYITSGLRLLGLPLILLILLYLLGIRGLKLAIPVLITAMPVAVNGVMLAELYGSDSEMAAQSTFISTLLSIFTIPLLAGILSFLS